MKITWFGGSAFRLHIGGQVVVVDGGADVATEIGSGADLVVESAVAERVDGAKWRPRAAQRLLEAEEMRDVEVWSAGSGSLIVDADDERPLLLVSGAIPQTGRWAGDAVVVLAGPELSDRAEAVIEAMGPRLLALAGSEEEIDAAIAVVRDRLDGTGLVALEAGLAVEA